jgi:hypothetical protein
VSLAFDLQVRAHHGDVVGVSALLDPVMADDMRASVGADAQRKYG